MSTDLRFDPAPECDRPACCDLSCVWNDTLAPLLWEGDDS